LVVGTNFLKEQLLQGGLDAQRISVLLPAPPPTKPFPRSTFGPRNLIVYVGPIQRPCGVSVLLESLALIRTPFECVLVGDGSYRPFCERLSRRMGLDHRVRFLPGLPVEGLAKLYSESTLLAISSLQPEPLAPVGLQAMHHGLPVVAFDQGGIRDWLSDGENGYLVPCGNRPVFAARMEHLLKDKALAQILGDHGRHRLQREFSFDRYLDDVERVWMQTFQETSANLSGSSLPR
jgi:glycosyltransferase involved in cell wall biosynthesis